MQDFSTMINTLINSFILPLLVSVITAILSYVINRRTFNSTLKKEQIKKSITVIATRFPEFLDNIKFGKFVKENTSNIIIGYLKELRHAISFSRTSDCPVKYKYLEKIYKEIDDSTTLLINAKTEDDFIKHKNLIRKKLRRFYKVLL